MTRLLPTVTDRARYSFEVELDRVFFKFDFEWVERVGSWFFSLSNAQGVALISGQRVIVGTPLLNRFRQAGLPAGLLIAVDTSNADIDPGFADLGDRVKLYYLEVADIPAKLVIFV